MFSGNTFLETVLMRNWAIQLRNDFTVTFFLDQSSQKFELFLEIIISTSAQNFSKIKWFVCLYHIALFVALNSIVTFYKVETTLAEFPEMEKSSEEKGEKKLWPPALEMKFSRDHLDVNLNLDCFARYACFSGR